MKIMKFFHIFGWLLLVLAVAGVEGGGFTTTQGLTLGVTGNVIAYATMKWTGWYYD